MWVRGRGLSLFLVVNNLLYHPVIWLQETSGLHCVFVCGWEKGGGGILAILV